MAHVNVYITDIVGEHGTPKTNIRCSCGIEQTVMLADAIPNAVDHIKRVHKHGRFHYKSITRAINIDGRSWPVLTNARVVAINRNHIER